MVFHLGAWLLNVAISLSHAVILSPQETAQLVIDKSYRAKEVSLSVKIQEINLLRAEQVFDWILGGELTREESRFEPFSGLPFNRGQNQLNSSFNLRKFFPSGTLMELTFLHTSTTFDLPAGGNQFLPPTVNVWTSSFNLSQSLWRNFFGAGSRREVEAQRKLQEVAKLQQKEDTENLVLDALRGYWNLVTAKASYEEAKRAKERYQDLLKNVRKRQSVGFAAPGELAQVEAELENRDQALRRSEAALEEATQSFRSLLNLPENEPIELRYPTQLGGTPLLSLEPFDVEKTRPAVIARLRAEALQRQAEAARAQTGPDVQLLAQYGIAGVDQFSSIAREEWLRADRPRAFVGVRFQWELGSDWREGDYRSRLAAGDQARWSYQRMLMELETRKQTLRKRLEIQEQVIKSLNAQKQWRQRALKELSTNYNLGRVEIRTLIESMNLAFGVELEILRALGEYQVGLAEWQALKDELISF